MLKTIATLLAAVALVAAGSAQELKKVRFVTDWKAQAEQGGFY